MPVKHRTAAEQAFWDRIAEEIVLDCFRRDRKPQGCAHLARDVADSMLAQRRDSQANDTWSRS